VVSGRPLSLPRLKRTFVEYKEQNGFVVRRDKPA
jgi:hypothetical protein